MWNLGNIKNTNDREYTETKDWTEDRESGENKDLRDIGKVGEIWKIREIVKIGTKERVGKVGKYTQEMYYGGEKKGKAVLFLVKEIFFSVLRVRLYFTFNMNHPVI